jgi:hypothetical protein
MFDIVVIRFAWESIWEGCYLWRYISRIFLATTSWISTLEDVEHRLKGKGAIIALALFISHSL